MDYYLKLDDNSSPVDKALVKSKSDGVKELVRYCGENCVLHDLHVVSMKAQKVWISLNTWREKTMPKGCRTAENNDYHGIYPSPTQEMGKMGANSGGTLQLGPYTFEQG